jgi:Tfp pilus assembly protein PilX
MVMVQRKNSRGSALLIALVVVILIGGLSAAFLTMSYSQSRNTFKASEADSSMNTCEAGVDDAINKLNAMSQVTWKGNDPATKAAFTPMPFLPPPAPPPSGQPYQGQTGTYIQSSLVTTAMDFYALNTVNVTSWVWVPDPLPATTGKWNPVSNSNYTGAVNTGAFDVTVSPAFCGAATYTITVHGTHGKERKGLSVLANPVAGNVVDNYGMVGKVTLTATSSNVFVDSFKSSLGTYASQATNTYNPGGIAYARSNGNVGSNGNISINNGIIFGNATPGPTDTVTTGKAVITGSQAPASAPLPLPSVTYDPIAAGAGPVVANPTQTFGTASALGSPPPPTLKYHVASLSGPITVNGPTILYVDGAIDMHAKDTFTFGPNASLTIYQGSGDITLNGQSYTTGVTPQAGNLIINSSSTGAVTFNGGADVYANVYAPDATFKQNGTSTYYGRIVASTITIGGNMTFHRDEDVNNGPSAPPVFKIKSLNETLY